MKLRVVLEDNKYYVEHRFLFFWIKYKKEVFVHPDEVRDLPVAFTTYDEALNCANNIIEESKSRKTKVICEEIEI